MNDPRRPERFSPPLPGSGPTGPQGPRYAPPADPAYADQAPYGPSYGLYNPHWAPSLNETNPTRRLPAYWQQEQPPPGGPPTGGLAPPPPQGPKSPRWLWIAAGAAVLLVVGLVIALVLANGAIKTQTAVPPLPAMPGSSPETTPPTPSTRTSPPSRTLVPAPPPSGSTTPTVTTGPAVMQSVVYNVSGDGRAISITYWDTGDVIQTEFNVALPWSKEVSLSQSAIHPASVTVINIGHNVTCTLTVDGVQVRQRVGAGITICDARN
jgi:Mycobacterium membrane protein